MELDPPLYQDLSMAAQTAYAEVLDQARAIELDALISLNGSFQRHRIKAHDYIYFGYRDPLTGSQRRIYVGPADERVLALMQRHQQVNQPKRLAPNAQAAIALGCSSTLPKHFRIIRQLAAHGFFKAGGVLIGTHAFVAIANLLGLRWACGDRTLDVDFAHAGRNVSLALQTDVKLPVHDALTSLELGLLPMQGLSNAVGGQYVNPADPELRLDFLTSMTRTGAPVVMEGLGLALQPLPFMEFSLDGVTQAALLGRDGACVVNIPAPARYAVHKLIVFGERDLSARVKAVKDLQQAAALVQWHLNTGQAAVFNAALNDARKRGKGWRSRAEEGRKALLAKFPRLADKSLWA